MFHFSFSFSRRNHGISRLFLVKLFWYIHSQNIGNWKIRIGIKNENIQMLHTHKHTFCWLIVTWCVFRCSIYIYPIHIALKDTIYPKGSDEKTKKKQMRWKKKKSEKNFIQRMYDGCACIYLFIPCTFVIQWQLNYIHVILWSVCLAHCFPRFVWMILRFFFVAFVCRHHWAYHQHFHHLLRKFTDFKSSNQKPFSLKFTWDWTTKKKKKKEIV